MNKYILIIEDNAFLKDALTWSLESLNYSVVNASNGQEALDIIKKREIPTLILLDLMMPVMDGFQFLKVLKNSISKSIPTIIVSACPNMEATLDTNEFFLAKPFDFNKLLELIKIFY